MIFYVYDMIHRNGMVWYVMIGYDTIQCNTIQYNTTQHSTVQYSTIQYNTIQYNTIQYYTGCSKFLMNACHFVNQLTWRHSKWPTKCWKITRQFECWEFIHHISMFTTGVLPLCFSHIIQSFFTSREINIHMWDCNVTSEATLKCIDVLVST